MDGYIIAGMIVATAVPTWIQLIRMNRDIGRLEGKITHLNGHLEKANNVKLQQQ